MIPGTDAVAVIVSTTPTCATLLKSEIDVELLSLFTVIETFAVACNPELFCVPVTTYEVTEE
jgi:hypothetical protein